MWSTENPVFTTYLFYSTILALKMVTMSPLTSYFRRTKLVWINPEDAARRNVKQRTDEDVERVRRAHRNDLENIVPFWILGLFLMQVDPSPLVATTCFRLFTLARLLHSVAYLKQKSTLRGNLFLIGFIINVFMGVYILFSL